MVPRFLGRVWLASAWILLASGTLAAQDGGWTAEGEVGASLFFGNTSQSTVSTRAATSHSDSTLEFSSQASFTYGESENDRGESFVVNRAWDLEGSLDWRPYAILSPFVSGQVESSLQRRIDFRFDLGGGAKYTFAQSDRSRVDLSVALLAERTFRDQPATEPDERESLLARWSTRFRARHQLEDDRITLSTVNHYRPVFDAFGNYVVESRSSVSYALSEIVTLNLAFRDIFDSRAVARGADTNNEGQLLFSVLGSF